MHREFGTLNDEMARFLFDARTGQPVNCGDIRSELVKFRDLIGVRVWVEGVPELDLRIAGLRAFLHPAFSYTPSGSLSSCVFFPELISQILALEGVETVVVCRWAMNTIFGGFNPSEHYYQTNFWELENNDTLLFSKLIEAKRLPFLGTHDLIAHLAGVFSEAWLRLPKLGTEVRETLEASFSEIRVATIASLILPYTLGVVLDDLAQPPNYDSLSQRAVLQELLRAVQRGAVPPSAPLQLLKFPSGFQTVIATARDSVKSQIPGEPARQVDRLVDEIRAHSFRIG
jgi:hypothetical protein